MHFEIIYDLLIRYMTIATICMEEINFLNYKFFVTLSNQCFVNQLNVFVSYPHDPRASNSYKNMIILYITVIV